MLPHETRNDVESRHESRVSKLQAALSAVTAENDRLREAIERVLSPAPGVRKPDAWVYGILRAALTSEDRT